MMQPLTHIVKRLGIGLMLLPGILAAQDLESVWRAYLAVDNRLETAVRQEQEWMTQQQDLYTEIRQLEAGTSWYSGWMKKGSRIVTGRERRRSSVRCVVSEIWTCW